MNFKQLNYNYSRNQQYRGEVCNEKGSSTRVSQGYCHGPSNEGWR